MRICRHIFAFFLLLGCDTDTTTPETETEELPLLETITSASVIFSHSNEQLTPFFAAPTLAYVSGYFYFEDPLAPDVIFGLDIEHFEGVDNPLRFEGADWMALAGFTREGILWFPIGSPENLEGVPTPTDQWEIRDFEVELQPLTWYKMTITCDFDRLEFVSVSLQGGAIDKTLSLSGFPLEYPNYAAFDKPALTGYTFAIRGLEFSPENLPGFDVYFDDIEMGIYTGTEFITIMENGFENQQTVGEIPINAIPIPLADISENRWYMENEQAKLEISDAIKRSGAASLKCSANLEQ
ncbi:MAG: hypothetical protein AAF634_04300 [Bacteroidota bacterium]